MQKHTNPITLNDSSNKSKVALLKGLTGYQRGIISSRRGAKDSTSHQTIDGIGFSGQVVPGTHSCTLLFL
jgi:hypothetical protein